jgi:hypothetical protein
MPRSNRSRSRPAGREEFQVALSPLMNVPILSQDSVIEVVRKGDGSQENDEIFITTTLALSQEIDSQNEVTLLLPLASETQQKPLMRYVADEVQEAITFDPVERSVYDQKVADALQDLQEADQKEQKALADAIADAAKGFSHAVLTVKPGQRQLCFSYTVAATGRRRESLRRGCSDRSLPSSYSSAAPLGSSR